MIKNISRMKICKLNAIFGEVIYAPGGLHGPRTQRDVQLVAIHEGEADIEIEGIEHHLTANEVALLRPGRREYFRFSQSTRTRHSWCAISPTLLPSDLRRQIRQLPFSRALSARMGELIRLGLSLATSNDEPNAELLRQALGVAAVREFVLGTGRAPVIPESLQRAQNFIETEFASPLTLTVIARAAGASAPHLIRLFRVHLGETPSRYLWKIRTAYGVSLLADTGLSISEIAALSGFQTPFHFSRLAKQQFGASPKTLRAQSWASHTS